jgi:hypothetical protein
VSGVMLIKHEGRALGLARVVRVACLRQIVEEREERGVHGLHSTLNRRIAALTDRRALTVAHGPR